MTYPGKPAAQLSEATPYTELSFALGAMSRDELENYADESGVAFTKHTTSAELRSLILESRE